MPNIKGKVTLGVELESTRWSASAPSICATSQFGLWRKRDSTILDDSGATVTRNGTQLGGELVNRHPVVVHFSAGEDGRNFAWGAAGVVNLEQNSSAPVDGVHVLVNQMCECASLVNRSCGLHLHVGRPKSDDSYASAWKPDQVRTWLAVGLNLEMMLFGMVPASRRKNSTCRPIAESYTQDELISFYPTGRVAPEKRANPKRYCWLNVIETQRPEGTALAPLGTVEIRLLGNTRRREYVQAWANLWLKVSALIASLPASLAVLHCRPGSPSIQPLLDEVAAQYMAGGPENLKPDHLHEPSALAALAHE